MKFEFTAENKKIAEKEIAKYPLEHKKSAVMALLMIAQKQNNNYLSKDCLEYVSDYLNMPIIKVMEVASFYSMYNLKPIGKYHIQVCSNVVCYMHKAEHLLKKLETLNDKINNSSEMEIFTISKVECLGACANAPVIQINDDYYENVKMDDLDDIISSLKDGKIPKVKKIVKSPSHLSNN